MTLRAARLLRSCVCVSIGFTFCFSVGDANAFTFFVNNANDSGAGSLRAAIINANTLLGQDTIEFNIPGDGPHLINILTALPIIESPLTIDGYTQAGASVNSLIKGSNAVIKIQIDGNSASGNVHGLATCAHEILIRGLSITRFPQQGVSLSSGGDCGGPLIGNVIEGNFIGLAADGITVGGNKNGGVLVAHNQDTRIGGIDLASRNLISANVNAGITIVNSETTGTSIDGNYIGLDRSGDLDRGNTGAGIRFLNGGGDTNIGSANPNRIAFNNEGIFLNFESTGVTAFANEIGPNDQLGIDLCRFFNPCPDGLSTNDENDVDAGANDLQNFPVITSAVASPGQLQFTGSLDRTNAAGTRQYAIAVYANTSCDVSGNGEGQFYLDAISFTSATVGSESFSRTIDTKIKLPVGTAITMTATDLSTKNTSEFSTCFILSDTEFVFANGFE